MKLFCQACEQDGRSDPRNISTVLLYDDGAKVWQASSARIRANSQVVAGLKSVGVDVNASRPRPPEVISLPDGTVDSRTHVAYVDTLKATCPVHGERTVSRAEVLSWLKAAKRRMSI